MKTPRTTRVSAPTMADLPEDCLFVLSAETSEARGRAPFWQQIIEKRPDDCVQVVDQRPHDIEVLFRAERLSLSLKSPEMLGEMVPGHKNMWVDISGLAHHVWAPIVKWAVDAFECLSAVYVEPATYRSHPSPTSTSLYDLSEGFRGLEPLPGFSNLNGPGDKSISLYVPFLGFEGTRARHLAMELGDPIPKVVPVVGVPGFRPDYPQITVTSNQQFLQEQDAYPKIKFARASCPFEAFEVLIDIRKDFPGSYLYLAPVGTKPHALGAVCFAIKFPEVTEIVYDHPHRKIGRTQGVGITHIYSIKPSPIFP